MAMARSMGRPSSPPFALIGAVVLFVLAVAAAVVLFMQLQKELKNSADIQAKADGLEREVAKRGRDDQVATAAIVVRLDAAVRPDGRQEAPG